MRNSVWKALLRPDFLKNLQCFEFYEFSAGKEKAPHSGAFSIDLFESD
jgi:hypothetical protein